MELDDEIARQLREAVYSFAKPDPAKARAVRDDMGGFDLHEWRAMGEQGWLAATAPERLGGADLGAAGATMIARPLGYGMKSLPFAELTFALACLKNIPEASGLSKRAEMLASGHQMAGIVRCNFGKGSAVKVMESRSSYRLEGRAEANVSGNASGFIVPASTGHTWGLFWVALEAPGLELKEVRLPAGGRSVSLAFSKVDLSSDDVIAFGAGVPETLCEALDMSLITRSAELLGLMDRVLELSLDHLRSRKQFGRAIGSFQVLQHRAVDMWIQRELTEAAVKAAARAFDNDTAPDWRSALASAAMVRACSAATAICNHSVQLHGAIGITDEYELSLHFNRALVLTNTLGTAFEHRRRFMSMAPKADPGKLDTQQVLEGAA